VHRVVREGLTNVHRHALGATPSVLVERGPGQVRVSIRNSAHTQRAAAQPPGTGRGLVGVQERVRMLGGAFSAGPLAHGGFELAAVLPLAIGATDAAAPPAQIAPADRAQVPRHRSPRPSPTDRLARTGMAAILAGGMIGAAALVAASLQTVTFASADEAGNNPFADFDAAKLGTARRDLENSLGTGDPLALAAARTIEPARPGQVTDCAYWYIQQDDRPGTIERFCYRSEVLAEKTRFGLTP
jgi:hypothetical protein